jgi:hypothetical protein
MLWKGGSVPEVWLMSATELVQGCAQLDGGERALAGF